jgi:hypothetical protein
MHLLEIRRFFDMFCNSFVVKNPLNWRLMQEAKLICFTAHHVVDGEENQFPMYRVDVTEVM